MAIKLRNEYGPVLHMPTSKENLKEKGPQNATDSYPHKQYPANQGENHRVYKWIFKIGENVSLELPWGRCLVVAVMVAVLMSSSE